MNHNDYFEKCQGEGQGSCAICNEKGKWNREWMKMLSRNKIDGKLYCSDCVREYLMEKIK